MIKRYLIGGLALSLIGGVAFGDTVEQMQARMQAKAMNNVKQAAATQAAMAQFVPQMRALSGKPNQQVALLKQVTAKLNVVDIWASFVAEADLPAIKALWPDPSDEKVYMASKNAMSSEGGTAELGAEIDKAMDRQTGAVQMADKKGATAFALKRGKSGQIRLVNSASFSGAMVGAALLAGKTETVKYFEAQCGGFTPEFNQAILKAMLDVAFKRQEIVMQISAPREQWEKKLAKAEDKYDTAKAKQEIAKIDAQLKEFPPFSVHGDTWNYFFKENKLEGAIAFFDREVISKWAKQKSDSFMMLAALKQRDAAVALQAKAQSGDMSALSDLMKIQSQMQADQENGKKAVGNVTKLIYAAYGECLEPGYVLAGGRAKWKQGLIHREKCYLMAGKNPGEWVAAPGYRKVAENKYEWTPKKAHSTAEGVVAGQKEGTWDTMPGFVWNDKKTTGVWKAGLTHADRPGLISTEKSYQWVPDKGYRWKKPADDKDFSVEKE